MTNVDVGQLFGANAGKIWKVLSQKRDRSVSDLTKETKLNASDVYAALGWLGREGKIIASRKKSGISFSLS